MNKLYNCQSNQSNIWSIATTSELLDSFIRDTHSYQDKGLVLSPNIHLDWIPSLQKHSSFTVALFFKSDLLSVSALLPLCFRKIQGVKWNLTGKFKVEMKICMEWLMCLKSNFFAIKLFCNHHIMLLFLFYISKCLKRDWCRYWTSMYSSILKSGHYLWF